MDILSDVKISGNLNVDSIDLSNGFTNDDFYYKGVRFEIAEETSYNMVRLTRSPNTPDYIPTKLVVENFCVSDNFNFLHFSSSGIYFDRGGNYFLCMDSNGMRLFKNDELINSFEPYKQTINHIEVPAECISFYLVSEVGAYYTNISVWDEDSCKKVEMDIKLVNEGIIGEMSSPSDNIKKFAVVYNRYNNFC